MKIKKLKQLLSEVYYQGIYDGVDISRQEHDMFFGDRGARVKWEALQLSKFYMKLKIILK